MTPPGSRSHTLLHDDKAYGYARPARSWYNEPNIAWSLFPRFVGLTIVGMERFQESVSGGVRNEGFLITDSDDAHSRVKIPNSS
jgi:hypothetical protein